MKIIDQTFESPQENLHIEEAYLADTDNILRFWESDTYFVVLGRSNKPEIECDVSACQVDCIPILKRVSGGGTVLQGPGCLNYALIVNTAYHPDLEKIDTANAFVMQTIADALQPILPGVEVSGFTDLSVRGKKISGNAQRRTKNRVLFHGTFLRDFDLDKIAKYLKFPSKQPDYRQNRGHLEFVQNCELSASEIKARLIGAFQ